MNAKSCRINLIKTTEFYIKIRIFLRGDL